MKISFGSAFRGTRVYLRKLKAPPSSDHLHTKIKWNAWDKVVEITIVPHPVLTLILPKNVASVEPRSLVDKSVRRFVQPQYNAYGFFLT